MTLSVFRMNTCKKRGRGPRPCINQGGTDFSQSPCQPKQGRNIQASSTYHPTLSIQSTHKPQTQPHSAPHEIPPSAEYSQTPEADTPQSPKPPQESSRQQPRHWQQTTAIARRRSSP